jgi:hypothetical protein
MLSSVHVERLSLGCISEAFGYELNDCFLRVLAARCLMENYTMKIVAEPPITAKRFSISERLI